jgi:hypothetical protein
MQEPHRPDDELPWGLMAGVWLFSMLWWWSAIHPQRMKVVAMVIAVLIIGVYFWLGQ